MPHGCQSVVRLLFNSMDCLNTIIGLSRAVCSCDVTPPDGYNTSDSGLYLDEIAPFDAALRVSNCGCTSDDWTAMVNARAEAIKTFQADLLAMLMTRYKPRRNGFEGTIGEARANGAVQQQGTYGGIRIGCHSIRGGALRIRKVGGIFSATGAVTLTLYNSLNAVVQTVTLNAVAGAHTTVAVDWTLPLHIPYAARAEYFLVYQYNSGNAPRQNNLSCGCGGWTPWFDWSRTMWQASEHAGSRSWANWLMVGGWWGNDLTSFDNCSTSSNAYNMNGLTLDVSLGCDVSSAVCGGRASLDYDRDPLALSMAFAVRYKAADLLIMNILRSEKLVRSAQTNREALAEARREYLIKYNEAANYIAANLNVENNDCLACSHPYAAKLGTIQA